MNNNSKDMIEIKHNIKTVLLSVFVLLGTIQSFAQIRVPFTPRTSTDAPAPYTGVQNYNLQGDFTMIGNTNLTLVNYYETGSYSHNGNSMRYVDVDNVTSTLNSSSAQLNIPDANCSEIIYAGLYWTGRAHDGNSSPDIFLVGGSTDSRTNGNSFNGYSLSITSTANNNAVYVFTPNNSGLAVTFRFIGNNVTVQVGSGSEISISGSITSSSNSNYTFSLTSPYTINTGAQTIYINSLRRTNNSTTINTDYNASVTSGTGAKLLDKRRVQLKKDNLPYKEITATEIYFPSGISDNLYSGYADVTDYIRTNGVGNYFVADIATQEGRGGAIGYSAGWGMVIIYKNPSMKWRDITVFDGFGYIASGGSAVNFNILGFRAAQRGEVKIKVGVMAGEGDNYYSGDYFNIKNTAGDLRRIDKNGSTAATSSNGASSSGNSNFFNSSVLIGGATRNPNLINNTGVDFVMFELDNPWDAVNNRYSIIPNNATSTSFQFGTNLDAYSLFNLIFAVDAYVPDVVAENVTAVTTPPSGTTVDPGDQLEFNLNLYNKGTEAVNNLKIEIPIPFNLHYDSSTITVGSHPTIKIPNSTTVTWVKPAWAPVGATPQDYAGGTLVWNIGTLPSDPNINVLQGTLKYKFKVTSNCALLSTAGPCGLKINVNGTISGEGATSGVAVSAKLVRDYAAGSCSGAIYDDFESTIAVSEQFKADCAPPPVENGMLQFKAFCSLPGNAFPRADIAGKYPLGTKFFTTVPTNYDQTTNIVTGDFPVNTDGSKRTFYAVVPGMDPGCYISLQTSLLLVTTQPTVQNVSACQGTSVVLQNSLSSTGVTSGYQLYYFDSASATTPLSAAPNPTAVATHNYWVAEGTSVSGTLCIGPKVPFTVTINPQPAVPQNVGNISICENNDAQITVNVTGATTYIWEYATSAAPSMWNTLNNTTYNGQITVNNTVLNISHATAALNGIKVRLKAVNSNNCESLSNTINIEIKGCRAITNPALPNKTKKTI